LAEQNCVSGAVGSTCSKGVCDRRMKVCYSPPINCG
jgi:hypothetical protein